MDQATPQDVERLCEIALKFFRGIDQPNRRGFQEAGLLEEFNALSLKIVKSLPSVQAELARPLETVEFWQEQNRRINADLGRVSAERDRALSLCRLLVDALRHFLQKDQD